MGELMRKQIAREQLELVVDERAGVHAIVARLMMLETEMRDAIAQSDQEVIAVVVMRRIQSARFANEIAEPLHLVRAHVQILRSIGRHVEVMLGRDLLSKRNFLEEKSRQNRRIDEHFKRYGPKVRNAALH